MQIYKNKEMPMEDVEIVPIAIPLDNYNQKIANLIEHLLQLDQQILETDKMNNEQPKEVA
jgi:hypothetical protein